MPRRFSISPFPKNTFQNLPTARIRLLAPTRVSQEEENRPRTPRPAEKPLCHAGTGTTPCRVAGVPASPLPEKPSCCPRSCLRRRVLKRALRGLSFAVQLLHHEVGPVRASL